MFNCKGGHCLGTLNVINLSVSMPLLPVGTATNYGLEARGSIPDRRKRVFLLHSVQNGSGAQLAIYLVGTGGFFLANKGAEEGSQSLTST
jgi:hypothetical protein